MSSHHDHIKNDPRWKAARVECFDRDDYRCVDCEAEDDLQADHIYPLALIFADGVTPEAIDLAVDVDNLVTRCGPCNRAKSDTVDQGLTRPPYVNEKYPELIEIVMT